MKKILIIAFILALAALPVFTACTESTLPETPSGQSPDPTEAVVSDPPVPERTAETTEIPTEEAAFYTLGEPAEADAGNEWIDAARAEGRIAQEVTAFSIADRSSSAAGRFVYDSFISITGEEPDEPCVFNDGCSLAIDLSSPSSFPGADYHYIKHPEVCAAFIELISARDYSSPAPEVGLEPLTVDFMLTDADSNEIEYTLYRDGYVSCGGSFASEPLSERETAYFFAVKLAYGACVVDTINYTDLLPALSEDKGVLIEKDGETLLLTGEQAIGFLKLVSDNGSGMGCKCVTRFNCGSGETGGEALRFSIVGVADGEPHGNADEFILFTSGRVAKYRISNSNFGSPMSDETFDSLYADHYTVSESAFDVSSCESFLAGIGD